MSDPLAFHLTWTTYGTWLSGDSRGWVKDEERGIQEPDPELAESMRGRMTQQPVVLSPEHRAIVDKTIREVIAYGGWTLHAINVRTNHIHLVVTADRDPET